MKMQYIMEHPEEFEIGPVNGTLKKISENSVHYYVISHNNDRTLKLCAICNKPFLTRTDSPYFPGTYCDDECRVKGWNRRGEVKEEFWDINNETWDANIGIDTEAVITHLENDVQEVNVIDIVFKQAFKWLEKHYG